MKCDFLVVGSGIAGLSFALRAATLGTVVVVTKKSDVDCATNLAQGGIAAVLDKNDSFDLHVQDTLASGDGLCDEKIVRSIIEDGPERIADLVELGVSFVKESSGDLSLGREGGHSRRRVAHAYDLTGKEIERALVEKVRKDENILFLENRICVDLIMGRDSKTGKYQCAGGYILEGNRVTSFFANKTILCTGGAGKAYLYTSNPDIATGDGIAMAFRAGAEIANMEFVQFHPTCLYHHQAKNFLITEAVRGEGAVLRNSAGERFMEKYDPKRMELATRDKVAQSIDQEMKSTGADCVYLDISHKDEAFLKERFPNVYGRCLELGINIAQEPIPVVPAAHYMCGGVLTDENGSSTVPGLMALGEVSCTGLHGGNRLASNSLLEAVVYANRAYEHCRNTMTEQQNQSFKDMGDWTSGKAVPLDEEILINHNWDLLRRIMWNYVGIVRTERRLGLAAQRVSELIKEIEQHYINYHISTSMVELRNIAIIANLIIQSAILRKESRGLHYVKEYPEKLDSCAHWNVLRRMVKQVQYPWQAEKVYERPLS